jgi:predicted nucleic acid-binding protein
MPAIRDTAALRAVSAMSDGVVADVDDDCAITAAKFSLDHGLPMADSVIFAVAYVHKAVVWTQDADFKNIPGVKYIAKHQ